MEFIHAIALGLIEGVTEFLPISSTGHLILAERVLQIPATDFWKSFTVIIQLGAILAVLVLYWRKLLFNREVFKKVALAFLPTAIIGLVLYPLIKQYFLGSTAVVLWALLLGGIGIIIFEKWHKTKIVSNELEQITYKQSFFIGLAQAVAVIPGISRAAATILGGLALGISRAVIVEFSFLLAIPTMAAATGLDLLKSGWSFTSSEWGILTIGFVVSFFASLVAVKWLLRFITSHSFTSFGWYRIILALVAWSVFF